MRGGVHRIIVGDALITRLSAITCNVQRSEWQDDEEIDEHYKRQKGKRYQASPDVEADPCCGSKVCSRSDKSRCSSATAPRRKAELSIVMCQTKEAQFTPTTAKTSQDYANHLGGDGATVFTLWSDSNEKHSTCRQQDKHQDACAVGNMMYKVRGYQLDASTRNDIGQQNQAFWYGRTDKVEGSREYNDIEDVVDES